MVYVIQVCWQRAVSKPVWHIPLLCVQWKTPYDGQRNCLEHVEFYSKNKFEKLVHLIGFIIRTNYVLAYESDQWILMPSNYVCHVTQYDTAVMANKSSSIFQVCTPADRHPRPSTSISRLSTLTRLGRTPSRAPAVKRYMYRAAGHELSVAPWRWGRGQSLKRGRTSTPWPGCLPKEINIA